ncbi:HEPN domain-containing protein, partial [Stakelama sediminis]
HARTLSEASVENEVLTDAAFMLHQATERLYICFLLVRTLYFPRSHNIKFLRSLAEDKEPRLVASWPREQRTDRRRFELLKRAYVEARYSAQYAITRDDLDALAAAIAQLRDTVETLCLERLRELKREADL